MGSRMLKVLHPVSEGGLTGLHSGYLDKYFTCKECIGLPLIGFPLGTGRAKGIISV